ncbi:hypothetical protein IFX79_004071 [Salmonella enterica]|nr:hypothetical protein [Salmonella enterica subsp. enterica serovar Newport]EGK3186770.1 hypothetical protein [Salmonella enterica]EGK9532697.1 hypothetical protein [Salmonella enterica]EGK9661713.1 hypothetical protein [Salmonella enterica]EGL4088989.1 hypothetical protein [Salmonella enterica]
MAQIKRSGEIRLGDARMCIWENPGHVDDAYERGFKREVFRRIIQTLNRLGWLVVIPQDKIESYSASFARQFRYCTKGDLKADLKLCGRCIELEFFQNVNAPDRPDNEGRYQYDKEKHMPYLLRMEMLRTRNRIVTYLSNVFDGYQVAEQSPGWRDIGPGKMTNMDVIKANYSTSWHFDGNWQAYLEKNPYMHTSNDRESAEKVLLEPGMRVWWFDHKGRIMTGTAWYHINNMWYVTWGHYGIDNIASFNLHTSLPERPRMKRNDRRRRQKLEELLGDAVTRMDYLRAHQLKQILYPDNEPLYRLFHTGHQLYHRPEFNGYTKDPNYAGKFRRNEVESFNPHENRMELVGDEQEVAV